MITRWWTHNDTRQEVEAIQLTAENVKEVAAWCDGFEVQEHNALDHAEVHVGVNVPTLVGNKRASENFYVVKYPRGYFDVVNPHLFEYEYQTA